MLYIICNIMIIILLKYNNTVSEVIKMKDKANKWYKLDNSGKIFPNVYSKRESHTFRIQASLTEVVNPEILQVAINQILERFPMFKVRLKRGLFWLYFDNNDRPFVISEMSYKLCSKMDFHHNNNYLFKVLYRNNVIAIEMFHALADGKGAVDFLESLIFQYLKLKGYSVTPDNMIKTIAELPTNEEYEDANKIYFDKQNRKRIKEDKAYRIQGTFLPNDNTGLISGILNTQDFLNLCRTKGVSVTQYIVALAMYSIYVTQIRYRTHLKSHNNPVKVSIPVNLRNYFPSKTLRNFSNVIKTNLVMAADNIEFDYVLNTVKENFKEKLVKEELIRKISENVAYEKILLLRLTPMILKKYILKAGYQFLGSKLNTMSISNIGRITLPESLKPYVKDFSVAMGAGSNSKVNCAIISYDDRIAITFTSSIIETHIQKEFFRHFTDLGIDVTIESNYMERLL